MRYSVVNYTEIKFSAFFYTHYFLTLRLVSAAVVVVTTTATSAVWLPFLPGGALFSSSLVCHQPSHSFCKFATTCV